MITGHMYVHRTMNHPISDKPVKSRIFSEMSVMGKNLNARFEKAMGAFNIPTDNFERGDYCTIYYRIQFLYSKLMSFAN